MQNVSQTEDAVGKEKTLTDYFLNILNAIFGKKELVPIFWDEFQ